MEIEGAKNKTKKYVALIAGGLLHYEILSVIAYLKESRIDELSKVIKDTNILKINSLASRIRFLTELKRRYRSVRSEVWNWLSKNDPNEQKITLFYICLKSTPILFDFQTEVVLEKWRSFNLMIDKRDVLFFLDKKSQFHHEIEQWSEKTKEKVATVIIRVLNEVGLLKANKLTQLDANVSYWDFFIKQGDAWFLELCLLPKNRREQIMDLTK